ncbi:MAG TPA: hypothetical protein VGQ38_15505 [Gaiellaceae bacterium]|nr:hypothetical protein [Gaiellaceae bacterium]
MKRSQKKWLHRDLMNPKHQPAIERRLARAEADAAAKKMPKPKRKAKVAPKKPPTHPARTARKRNERRKGGDEPGPRSPRAEEGRAMNIDDAHANKLADMLEELERPDVEPEQISAVLGMVGATLRGHLKIVGVNEADDLMFALTPAGTKAVESMPSAPIACIVCGEPGAAGHEKCNPRRSP